jgi:hypothetical protein
MGVAIMGVASIFRAHYSYKSAPDRVEFLLQRGEGCVEAAVKEWHQLCFIIINTSCLCIVMMGIRVQLLPFKDFIADLNCFVFVALDRLAIYCSLAFLSSFTALFLSFLYCCMSRHCVTSTPVTVAFISTVSLENGALPV